MYIRWSEGHGRRGEGDSPGSYGGVKNGIYHVSMCLEVRKQRKKTLIEVNATPDSRCVRRARTHAFLLDVIRDGKKGRHEPIPIVYLAHA